MLHLIGAISFGTVSGGMPKVSGHRDFSVLNRIVGKSGSKELIVNKSQ